MHCPRNFATPHYCMSPHNSGYPPPAPRYLDIISPPMSNMYRQNGTALLYILDHIQRNGMFLRKLFTYRLSLPYELYSSKPDRTRRGRSNFLIGKKRG